MTAQVAVRGPVRLMPLVAVTLVNYLAQVPCYLHNDYSAHHLLPGLPAVALLGATLAWFAVGLAGFLGHRRWGRPVLVSYLVTEAVFYGATIASGIFLHQLANPSYLIKAVFVVGYVSGAVAAGYAVLLVRQPLRRGLRAGAGPAG
jgi:hypothetical protein